MSWLRERIYGCGPRTRRRALAFDLELAKVSLKVALDKEPNYHKALYNIALVHARMGKRSEATIPEGGIK